MTTHQRIASLEARIELLEQATRAKVKHQPSNRKLKMQIVAEKVEAEYDLVAGEIFTRCKRRVYWEARQVAMFIMRVKFNKTFQEIVNFFGAKDHTTAIHATRVVFDQMSYDKKFAAKVQGIMDTL